MAQSLGPQPCPLDRTGSFFKLVDTLTLEIGELKKEMVQTELSLDGDSDPELALRGAEEVVSGVFLQPPSTGGTAGTRDSGYSSLRRRMSVLDRLVQTHPVWLQLSLSDEEAARILKLQPPGTFLVRKSCTLRKKVISLRLDEPGTPVQDFPVEESQSTFSLDGSGISFADLFRLVAFYCISRDVLPFPLRLPEAIATARTHAELEEVAQQGAAFWDSAVWRRSSERTPALRRDRGRRGASLPALRTRSPAQLERGQSNGALCFVNPLFLRTHRLLEERRYPEPPPAAQPDPSSASCGRVAWENSPPRSDKPRDGTAMPETVLWVGSTDAARASPPAPPSTPPVALRRSPEDVLLGLRRASSADALERDASAGQRMSGGSVSTTSSEEPDFSPEIFLQGSPRALTVGYSSLEEEEEEEEEEEARGGSDPETSSPPLPRASVTRRSSLAIPSVVKGKIRNAFSSLRKPSNRLEQRVLELSRDKSSHFGYLVQAHISFLQENHGMNASAEDLLQTLRQFMTNMKAYLAQCTDLDPSLWLLVREDEIDHVLEKAMHKCLLKPLKGVVDAALRDAQVRSGAWQQLLENLPVAKAKQPQDLGVEGAVPPDPDAIEKIRQKFQTLCRKYSPEKKVAMLLRVCKRIYTIMQDNSGRLYGADDFLPMLTYVLAQCDMPQLDAEIQYMMELLDPSLLQGEGGYYLTSAYGAMALIKNFREEQAARMLSSETRNTLHQWHRRRTSERVNPCIEDFQNYLRVALLEAGGGCTAKTFRVPPSYTAADVCRLCARKFRVADPESHALFLLVGDSVQQLAPDTHPQRIKAELHSRPRPSRFHFLYRRVSRTLGPTSGGAREAQAVGRVRPASSREPLTSSRPTSPPH